MQPTVYIENTIWPNVVKMIWQHDVNEADVLPAFYALTQRLNRTVEPLYVVMDLQARPKFPMAETITGAMSGPFGHPKLAYWLMIGTSRPARIIENVLTQVTRHRNTAWFNSLEEVHEFLQTKGVETA